MGKGTAQRRHGCPERSRLESVQHLASRGIGDLPGARRGLGQAASLFWLGRALVNRSDPEDGKDLGLEATRCFEEGLQLCTTRGTMAEVGWFRNWLSIQAYWNDDLDRSEQLASQVVDECTAAGTRHPIGQALCSLAFIARRRGDNDVALDFLQEAAAVYRDVGDPCSLPEFWSTSRRWRPP
jgi:hypothetical protein